MAKVNPSTNPNPNGNPGNPPPPSAPPAPPGAPTGGSGFHTSESSIQALQTQAADLQTRYTEQANVLAGLRLAPNALGPIGMFAVPGLNDSNTNSVDRANDAAHTFSSVHDGLGATGKVYAQTDQLISDEFDKIVPDSGAKNPTGAPASAPPPPQPQHGPPVSTVAPVPGTTDPAPAVSPTAPGPQVSTVQPPPGAPGTTAPASAPTPQGGPQVNQVAPPPGADTTAPAAASPPAAPAAPAYTPPPGAGNLPASSAPTSQGGPQVNQAPSPGGTNPASSPTGSARAGGWPPGGNDHITGSRPISEGVNATHLVSFDDGTSGVYKPVVGENHSMRQGIPGNLAGREVAAYEVDQLLGLDVVPHTTMIDGPDGEGSVQRFVPSTEGKYYTTEYSDSDREKMAVLDYVIGNSDRHPHNYRTNEDGGVVAIDHGYSFPESPDPRMGIRSEFAYAAAIGQISLSPELLAKINAVDPADLRATLEANGISEPAITGTLARLDEIKENGAITGQQWPGRFVSHDRIGPYHNPIFGPYSDHAWRSQSLPTRSSFGYSFDTPVSHPPLGPADRLPSLEVLRRADQNENIIGRSGQ